MRDPQRLKRWLIFFALAYLIFPRDLIPDFLGRGLGYIEDVVLILALRYGYTRYLRLYAAGATGDPGAQHQQRRTAPTPEQPFDPHAILGIPATATSAEIRSAYRARMAEYHPDKVAHLGEALQKLAHEKSLDIQRAYEQLVP